MRLSSGVHPQEAVRWPTDLLDRLRDQRGMFVVPVALGVLAAAVLLLAGSTRAPDPATGQSMKALAAVQGVPQVGTLLGARDAPATLTVFADVTDLRYRQFSEGVLPLAVQRHVRDGDLAIRIRPIAVQTDQGQLSAVRSEEIARLATAAGLQGRFWQYTSALAAENVGYVDASAVQSVVPEVAGLDAGRVRDDARGDRVSRSLARAAREREALGVVATPGFVLSKGEGEPRPLRAGTADPKRFMATLDAALATP